MRATGEIGAEKHESRGWDTDPRVMLERVIRAGQVGVWEHDFTTGRTQWNSILHEIAGIPTEQTPSLDLWLELVHPNDLEMARQIAEQESEEGRYRIIRPDGETRHVLIRVDQLPGDDQANRMIGVVIDVTEGQRVAAQVTSTLESMSDGYFAINRDWTLTYLNPKGEQIIGSSMSDLVGRNLWEAFPGALDTAFHRYKQTMDEGVQLQFEEFYEPLGKWFEVRSYPTDHGIAVYFRDVTARHEAEQERARMLEAERTARELAERAEARMLHQAIHDSLTHLLNRTELMRRLDRSLAEGEPVTILFLDVDRFKLVNDSLGHGVGDELLRTVARRLTRFAAPDQPIARFGGDEFVISLPGWDHVSASMVADRILGEIRQPMELGDNLIYATASIGIAQSRGEGNALDLVRNADVALYRAKDTGRDRAIWFDERLKADLIRRLDLEHRLRGAIDRDGLHLEFQPTFDLRTGKATDVEALARWVDPGLGVISPAAFIPVAEESGLIHRIGAWATGSAAASAAEWNQERGVARRFWVNISPRELARPDAMEMFRRELERSGLDPENLGIEVTESALAGENIVDGLRQVADLGVKVAIDDFGTGYSSISRLGELPVDYLKIDRSFVSRIGTPAGLETVSATIDLGHAIQARVVAEGVETPEQLRALSDTDCDLACGFLLARPVPLEELDRAAESGAGVLQEELCRS